MGSSGLRATEILHNFLNPIGTGRVLTHPAQVRFGPTNYWPVAGHGAGRVLCQNCRPGLGILIPALIGPIAIPKFSIVHGPPLERRKPESTVQNCKDVVNKQDNQCWEQLKSDADSKLNWILNSCDMTGEFHCWISFGTYSLAHSATWRAWRQNQ